MKLPAIQFYPADWRKDPGVQSLDYFDRGVWFEILCLMHESPARGKLMLNGAAMPDEALARILGLDNQTLTKTLTTLLTYGVASRDEQTGALMNRRMVKDEDVRKVRTEAGKKGGNPALLNQKATTRVNQAPTTRVKQIPTPSSSVSSSTTVEGDPRGFPFDHFAVLSYSESLAIELSISQAEVIAYAVEDSPLGRAVWAGVLERWKGNGHVKKNAGTAVNAYREEMQAVASGKHTSPVPAEIQRPQTIAERLNIL